ncbi:hypothetical protein J1N09_13215 [Aureitalea sp. L0-47]|uniref:hypothetical protein n=1 Tax=Aureitalea sp. L0-47 TaxID=2816962 RepID=UPI002237F453|nr:hypothetical protein [Aureitalea sp. L0-47]MCW5520801.1 hypothetical protein [Aureitalea sp. L0-47]
MKSRFRLLLFLLLFTSLTANAQKFSNPLKYLEFVSDEQEIITRNTWKYTKAIAHSRSDRAVDNKRNTLIKSIERAQMKIEKAEAYEGDEFKQNVLKNLELNKNLLQQDYAKIIDMKEVAEQSYDLMEAYMLARELADEKMTKAQQEYEMHYYAYARKHDINIIESESDLSKKMQISSDVFDHYNELYLIFFKVNMNEVYLYDAIEKNDIGAIEQSSSALLDSATEGLAILDTVSVYNKDQMLVNSTKKAFEFYVDEAEKQVPKLIDFLILNEEFETIRNQLENTPKKKQTKAQIDAYNEKVPLINKAVDEYNRTNTQLNKKRQEVVGGLKSAYERFLSKHIPKD